MLEIVIDNKNGNLWDVSGITSEATIKTARMGKAASLEFTIMRGGIYEDNDASYNCGDVVLVRLNGTPMFMGYIFAIESGDDESVSITAYDQLRYLMANGTYVFSDVTAAEIIEQIAGDFELKVGDLIDTEHKINGMVEDNKKLLDTICKALDQTLIATGKMYTFYDDVGKLVLRSNEQMALDDFALGDLSLVYGYKRKRSIESAYNYVKLVQDSKEERQRNVYVNFDSGTIARWGKLQLYQKVDDKKNKAQLKEMLDNLILLHNREELSFQLEAIGEPRVRAGSWVIVWLEEVGIKQRFLVEECTHKFDGTDHTMSLTLIDRWKGETST